jgi:misacylated tRNA(Ala) deacylase
MKALYLKDSYLQTFEAVIDSATENRVTLDQTAFYPRSGGQPNDLGSLFRGEEKFKVRDVESGDTTVHVLDREGLNPGDAVLGKIDWERRYRFMRCHSACHILSAVIFAETGAKITGNQIDTARSRVDFSLESFDKARMSEYVEKANHIIREDRPVKTQIISREEALEIPDLVRLAMDVPDREEIRVVEIEGVDRQACGGTHVQRTGEIVGIKMIKAENKGKSNRRVYFSLED